MYLVVQTAFLGDMILTTPLLEQLSMRGPVDVVATPANAALLANHPAVRDVIVFDKRGEHRGVGGMRSIARDIRYRRVDGQEVQRGTRVAYMAQGSLRSAAIARLAGVKEIVGFNSSAGRWLYSSRIAYDATRHHANRLLSLAGVVGSPGDTQQPSLFPGRADEESVEALLAAAGIITATPLVVLAPGSVWATKRWPYFDELALLLSEGARTGMQGALRIVVTGSRADALLAQAISERMTSAGFASPIDATGKLSLLATAALIRRAVVVVTNDSAPLHLASAMNTPTVALFGPTVPAFGFGPLADRRAVVEHNGLPCRPCDTHGPKVCPLGHWKCMRDIGPDTVVHAVRQQIAR